MTAERKYRLRQFGLLGVLLGLLLSQYHPLWGDARQRRAEPWTPVRKTLGGSHVLLFGLAGLAVGALVIKLCDE